MTNDKYGKEAWDEIERNSTRCAGEDIGREKGNIEEENRTVGAVKYDSISEFTIRM